MVLRLNCAANEIASKEINLATGPFTLEERTISAILLPQTRTPVLNR